MDCQGLVVRLIQDFVLLTTAVEVAQRWRELAEKLAKVSKQQMDAYESPHRDRNGVVDSEVSGAAAPVREGADLASCSLQRGRGDRRVQAVTASLPGVPSEPSLRGGVRCPSQRDARQALCSPGPAGVCRGVSRAGVLLASRAGPRCKFLEKLVQTWGRREQQVPREGCP
ncbi:SH3 domain-binding protein 4 [Galemys pyrenaicus]|uniref:SH3 domain-binding protein 4 n=1 Tax=Galemys pyrenaicus TaxID=202257 RepID=A0A8J6A5P0_GALPY|nr:SH3 domain-binding protein 4 [Galemys pyrenaicus]